MKQENPNFVFSEVKTNEETRDFREIRRFRANELYKGESLGENSGRFLTHLEYNGDEI